MSGGYYYQGWMTSRLVAEHVGSGMGEEEVAQGQMEKGRFGGVRSVCARWAVCGRVWSVSGFGLKDRVR